tara:strand:+ start:68 stop:679 length:612 start_codon:yes stop_codon:yes gene_type:complete
MNQSAIKSSIPSFKILLDFKTDKNRTGWEVPFICKSILDDYMNLVWYNKSIHNNFPIDENDNIGIRVRDELHKEQQIKMESDFPKETAILRTGGFEGDYENGFNRGMYELFGNYKTMTKEDYLSLHEKYFDLHWYSRIPDPSQNEEREIMEDKYPEETESINNPEERCGEIGFNSGMLAGIRLLNCGGTITHQSLDEFPMLDS